MVFKATTKAEFDEKREANKDKLIVVDFTAAWCGPCQMMAPHFEALSGEQPDVVFVKVDVDENERLEGADLDALEKKINKNK